MAAKEAERAQMLRDMEAVRRQVQAQEEQIRQALQCMEARGEVFRQEDIAELQAMLAAAMAATGSSPGTRATSRAGSGGPGSGGAGSRGPTRTGSRGSGDAGRSSGGADASRGESRAANCGDSGQPRRGDGTGSAGGQQGLRQSRQTSRVGSPAWSAPAQPAAGLGAGSQVDSQPASPAGSHGQPPSVQEAAAWAEDWAEEEVVDVELAPGQPATSAPTLQQAAAGEDPGATEFVAVGLGSASGPTSPRIGAAYYVQQGLGAAAQGEEDQQDAAQWDVEEEEEGTQYEVAPAPEGYEPAGQRLRAGSTSGSWATEHGVTGHREQESRRAGHAAGPVSC